jgi:uncharacterized membrane protein YphA (DoxX/SURF4 family)
MTLDSGPRQFFILLNRRALGYYVMNAGWEKVRREIDAGPGTFFASHIGFVPLALLLFLLGPGPFSVDACSAVPVRDGAERVSGA